MVGLPCLRLGRMGRAGRLSMAAGEPGGRASGGRWHLHTRKDLAGRQQETVGCSHVPGCLKNDQEHFCPQGLCVGRREVSRFPKTPSPRPPSVLDEAPTTSCWFQQQTKQMCPSILSRTSDASRVRRNKRR